MKHRNNILYMALFSMAGLMTAGDLRLEIDLKGRWLFEIGNMKNFAEKNFDDSRWETIQVPGNWEDMGFPGYDGFAWYRIHFNVPSRLSGATLYLNLGKIDDVDRVYLNGRFLNGSGGFPPAFTTAWDRKRHYLIPNDFLDFDGDNCLAVQVYDVEAEGGIRTGDIGIYSKKQPFPLNYNLSGFWKMMPGDNPEWAGLNYNDKNWSLIPVPGKWEHHGFPDLDGFAWYRKQFLMPKFKSDERWILVLGRIDDVDEVYFNGTRIGQTGEFPDRTDLFIHTGYGKLRIYSIPRMLIRSNQNNLIAVRVFDKGSDGGIYEGPVGLVNRKVYLKNKRLFQ